MAGTPSRTRPSADRLVCRGATSFLFLLVALLAPAALASAESSALPPLPVEVPAVGATVNEVAGNATAPVQPVLEAVTQQSSPDGSDSQSSPSGGSGSRNGGGSSGDPVGSASGAAEDAVGETIRTVTGAANADDGAGTSAPASSPAPTTLAPSPAATGGSGAAAPTRFGRDRGLAPHGRRADPDTGDARLLQPIGSLARSLGPLVEHVGAGLSLGALRAGAANLGGLLPSNPTGRRPRPAPESVGTPTSSSASPAILDPSRPQSWLLFICVVGAGALAIVYLLANELGARPFVALRRRL